MQSHGQGLATLGDHGAEAQPRGPAQEQGNQLQQQPSPHQAFADPSQGMIRAGRVPAGFCIRPPVPVATPLLSCPLHTCRDSPCFSRPAPRHHVREEAAGSAFFRYSRVTTARIGDFPWQFSLNFKPLVLSLSRATLGSQGRAVLRVLSHGREPSCPRNPPGPSVTTHTTLHCHVGTRGAVTRGRWKPPSSPLPLPAPHFSWPGCLCSSARQWSCSGLG